MAKNSNLYGTDPQGSAESIAREGLANKTELDIHGGTKDSRVNPDTDSSQRKE